MKRILFAGLALVASFASLPVAAQWGPPAGYGGGYGGGGYEGGRRYYEEDEAPPPRYRRPPGYGNPYGQGYGRRGGSTCVTARGSCPVGRPLPHDTPCGCNIPGFGYKRGAVY